MMAAAMAIKTCRPASALPVLTHQGRLNWPWNAARSIAQVAAKSMQATAIRAVGITRRWSAGLPGASSVGEAFGSASTQDALTMHHCHPGRSSRSSARARRTPCPIADQTSRRSTTILPVERKWSPLGGPPQGCRQAPRASSSLGLDGRQPSMRSDTLPCALCEVSTALQQTFTALLRGPPLGSDPAQLEVQDHGKQAIARH